MPIADSESVDCFSTWCLIGVALVWDQLSWSTVMCKLRACGCTESFANSCQVQECQQEKIPVISRDQVVDRYLAVFLTLGFELNTLETLVVGNKSWWIHSSLLAIFSSLLSSYSPQTFALQRQLQGSHQNYYFDYITQKKECDRLYFWVK